MTLWRGLAADLTVARVGWADGLARLTIPERATKGSGVANVQRMRLPSRFEPAFKTAFSIRIPK
ncbi:hypothetical protein [Paraburkholderia acidiphila]|uniref:Uncharacterized protein n=1 Tax=Paraburkholderia acidiphila TaxID=2571747 RepID=A0A7Z2JE97_9BURK|nr:hypothetical protein [Paraburkholderia acidiphila]QGZ59885.1 hypothetical protein FAZ97_33660 [Paraburkholderia acidiphila]